MTTKAWGRRAGGARAGATAYLLATGTTLLFLAAAGWVVRGRWFSGDPTQSVVHALLGVMAIGAAFWTRRAKAAAGLAIVLLGLGVLGTLTPRLFGYPARLGLALKWEVLENAAHIVLGAWGAFAAATERSRNPGAPATR